MTLAWRRRLRTLSRLVPDLAMRDPWFRYAAIAALLAMLFVIGQIAQDWAGPPPPSPTPAGAAAVNPQRAQTAPTGTAIRPPPPNAADIPAIAPGRSLQGIIVDPAPGDAFGKLPNGVKPP
jgi:hypothetical protein